MKWILTVSISILILGCSSSEGNIVRASIYDDISLELDQGKKWDVSDEMMPFMRKSAALIDQQNSQLELSNKLLALKDSFVNNCNMTGAGHDVLHHWLVPYMGLIDDFKGATEESDVESARWQLKEAHIVYDKYFE